MYIFTCAMRGQMKWASEITDRDKHAGNFLEKNDLDKGLSIVVFMEQFCGAKKFGKCCTGINQLALRLSRTVNHKTYFMH
jgi:hypothetical protein